MDLTTRIGFRKLLIQTIIISLSIIIFAIALLFFVFHLQVRAETIIVNDHEQIGIDVSKQTIKHDFKAAVQDLIRLSENEDIISILTSEDSVSSKTNADKLIDIVEWHNIYREARVLDQTGQELVSLDSRDGILEMKPPEFLQNQSERYYFKEAIALNKGEVYISPFDLNINYGKIEIPYIPVIRLAIPVFGQEDSARGIVILNYDGSGILKDIENADKSTPGKILLLNNKGYFLKGLKSEDEWGFLIEDRKDRNFQNLFSGNWDEIVTNRSGSLENESGSFIYDRINLKEEASVILQDLAGTNSYKIPIGSENDLIFVSYLSHELIQNLVKIKLGNLPLYLLFVGFGIILVIIIIALISVHYRLRLLKSQNDLVNSERLYRSLTTISPVGIFHTDTHGLYEYVNQRWCDITGLNPNDVIGTDGTSHINPDYRNSVLEKWQNLITKGEPFFSQFPLKNGDKEVWVLEAAVEEFNTEGLSSGFTGTLTDISNQKDVEKKLSYDRIKYSAVLDLAADAIITINEVGIIQEFNATAQRYFGYELDEIIGKNVMILAPEPHRSRHQGYIENYLRTGIAKIIGFPREISAVRKDGSIFPMELSVGEVLFDEHRLFTGIIRDISERKEAERLLLESEKFSSTTLDSLNASVVIVDKRGIIIGINQSWRNLSKGLEGANQENQIGANYFDVTTMGSSILNHDDALSFIEGIENVLDGKLEIFKKEYPFRSFHTNGWFMVSVTRFIRDNNKFAVISHVDITERVLVEEKLRQFKMTLDQTQDAVFIFDANSLLFLYANQGAVKQLGYTWNELKLISPVDISNIFTEESYREMISPLRNPDSNSLLFETVYVRKDGSEFPVNVRMQYIEESMDSSFIVIARDISEQKKINLELEQARFEAEQAAISKSDFLANMSHEIRTPMNAIIGMTYLALQTDLTEKQRDYILKINTSSKALLGIINDILDFSKIEAGKMSIEKIPISLPEIIDDIFILLAENIEAKGLEILINVDSNVPDGLMGDPVRIGQIFTNLINNAVKFTDKGEIGIHVRMVKQTAETVVLECSVSDTGIGLSQKHIKNLFQKFNQADSSTTRKYGGTGLGLTICQQLIELMGGEISVKSELEKGTTFTFSINLDIQENFSNENMKTIPREIRDLKSLLVGSNIKLVSLLEQQLSSLTFQVESTIGCLQSLDTFDKALINKTPFELIIIDYEVLEDDDCDFIDKLTQNHNMSLIPLIVIYSAKRATKAEESFKERSLCNLLKKPVTNASLFNAIMDVYGIENNRITRKSDNKINKKGLLDNIYNSTILLVEDNKINQQIACELLEIANVSITIAENGKEALKKVKEKSFELILMDIQMPIMDGIEATRKIRKLKSPVGKIPIIAMTAHAMAGDREKSIDAGIDDYITKPIDPENFYSCLSRWLKPKANANKTTKIRNNDIQRNFPEYIQGIDLKTALDRVSGNKSLFKNLLRDFIRENQGFSEKLSSALEESDSSSAKRLVHTLKGVSGNLGAEILQQKAEKLENAIIGETENIQDAMNDTVRSLNILIGDIGKKIQTENHSESESHILNEAEILDSLSKISKFRESLETGDMESLDLFNELKDYFSNLFPEVVDKLSKSLDELNFEKTLQILDAMKL